MSRNIISEDINMPNRQSNLDKYAGPAVLAMVFIALEVNKVLNQGNDYLIDPNIISNVFKNIGIAISAGVAAKVLTTLRDIYK